jgi:hypothetical protein
MMVTDCEYSVKCENSRSVISMLEVVHAKSPSDELGLGYWWRRKAVTVPDYMQKSRPEAA